MYVSNSFVRSLLQVALLGCIIGAFSVASDAQTGPVENAENGGQCAGALAITHDQFDVARQRAESLYTQQCNLLDYCSAPQVAAAYGIVSCLFNALTRRDHSSAHNAYLRGTLEDRAHRSKEAMASYSQCVSDPDGDAADVRDCLERLTMLACMEQTGDCEGTLETTGYTDSALDADAVARPAVARPAGPRTLQITIRNPNMASSTKRWTVPAPKITNVEMMRRAMSEQDKLKLRAAARDIGIEVSSR